MKICWSGWSGLYCSREDRDDFGPGCGRFLCGNGCFENNQKYVKTNLVIWFWFNFPLPPLHIVTHYVFWLLRIFLGSRSSRRREILFLIEVTLIEKTRDLLHIYNWCYSLSRSKKIQTGLGSIDCSTWKLLQCLFRQMPKDSGRHHWQGTYTNRWMMPVPVATANMITVYTFRISLTEAFFEVSNSSCNIQKNVLHKRQLGKGFGTHNSSKYVPTSSLHL